MSRMRIPPAILAMLTALAGGVALSACGTQGPTGQTGQAGAARHVRTSLATALSVTRSSARTGRAGQPTSLSAGELAAAGNPGGHAYVPPAGRPVRTSHPNHVIGHGTPAGCTSRAVVRAVAEGGVITFRCGPRPVTIVMKATAKVRNTSRRVVLDGGGKVTLSGGGVRRILYQDTCDKRQVWTTSHCQDQATPVLVVQNLTFVRGNSTGQHFDGGGGGAIFDRGGQLKVVNSRFIDNRCDATGPDLGGAAIRTLSQYRNRPVWIVRDTFRGGVCSNGGALSSIGVSWTVLNSVMSGNRAIGWGANPAQHGSPGGGSGGAIYNDGDRYTVLIKGTVIRYNRAREGGGAVFFVSDNNTGTLRIEYSTLHHNPSEGFFTRGYPGIFFHSAGHPIVIHSKLN
jgi:hypothetical protein